MNKHTPGPWTYAGTGGHIGSPDRLRVADVNSLEIDSDTRQANARLIAAAPDLLALAEAVAAHFGGTDAPLGAAARAAIAKAKGEAHADQD